MSFVCCLGKAMLLEKIKFHEKFTSCLNKFWCLVDVMYNLEIIKICLTPRFFITLLNLGTVHFVFCLLFFSPNFRSFYQKHSKRMPRRTFSSIYVHCWCFCARIVLEPVGCKIDLRQKLSTCLFWEHCLLRVMSS